MKRLIDKQIQMFASSNRTRTMNRCAAAIHIRRGDKTNVIRNLNSQSYSRVLETKIDNLNKSQNMWWYFLMSDDYEAVRELKLLNPK